MKGRNVLQKGTIDFEHEHETFLVLIEHFFEFKVFINLKFNGHDGYNGDTAKSMLMNIMEILDVGYLFSNQKPTLQIPLLLHGIF